MQNFKFYDQSKVGAVKGKDDLNYDTWSFDAKDVAHAEKKMTQRWCFKQDDDGHNFLIPVEVSSKFSEMLVSAIDEEDYAEFNNTFDQYSCDSFLNFTFEKPE